MNKDTIEEYKIIETAHNTYQVYKLLSTTSTTATYSRVPDYPTTGEIILFKSKKAAKDYIKTLKSNRE